MNVWRRQLLRSGLLHLLRHWLRRFAMTAGVKVLILSIGFGSVLNLSAGQLSDVQASNVVGDNGVIPLFLAAGLSQDLANQYSQLYLTTIAQQRYANHGQALQVAFSNYQQGYQGLARLSAQQMTPALVENVMQQATVLMAALLRYLNIPGMARIASGLIDPVTGQNLVTTNLPAGQTLDDYTVNLFVKIFTNLYQKYQVASQAGAGNKNNTGSGSQTSGTGSKSGTGGGTQSSGTGLSSQTGAGSKSGNNGTPTGSGSGTQTGSNQGSQTGSSSQTGSGTGGNAGSKTGGGGSQTGSTSLTPETALANAQTYAANLTAAVTSTKNQINSDAAHGVSSLQDGRDAGNSQDELEDKLNTALATLQTDYINALGLSGTVTVPLGILDQALVALDVNDPSSEIQAAQDTLGNAKSSALDRQTGLPIVSDLLIPDSLTSANYTQYLTNTGVLGQALQSLQSAANNPTIIQTVGLIIGSTVGSAIFIAIVVNYLRNNPEALTNLSQAMSDAVSSAQTFMQKLAAKFAGSVDPAAPDFSSQLEQNLQELWQDDAEALQIWDTAVKVQRDGYQALIAEDNMTKSEFQAMYQELLSGSMSQVNPAALQAMKNILNDKTFEWPIGTSTVNPPIISGDDTSIAEFQKYLSELSNPDVDDVVGVISKFDLTQDQFELAMNGLSGDVDNGLINLMNKILNDPATRWGTGGNYILSSSQLEQLNEVDVAELSNQLKIAANLSIDSSVIEVSDAWNSAMRILQRLAGRGYDELGSFQDQVNSIDEQLNANGFKFGTSDGDLLPNYFDL